jgi:hypothetical protein
LQESYLALIRILLPEGVVEFSRFFSIVEGLTGLHIYLEEKNYPEDAPSKADLLFKVYFPTIALHDFPIRGHKVFLQIKRRRWPPSHGSMPRQVKL